MKAEKFKLGNSLKNIRDIEYKSKRITDSIYSLGQGINFIRVDPIENTVTVDFMEEKISAADIQQKLRDADYSK